MKENTKIIWIIVIAVAVIFGAKYIKSINSPGYEKSEIPMSVAKSWNGIMAEAINEKEIYYDIKERNRKVLNDSKWSF